MSDDATSEMAAEDSRAILGAARDRDSRLLVRALGRLSAAHPVSWSAQLVRLVTSQGDTDRLWIMGHVCIHDAGCDVLFATFEVPAVTSPDHHDHHLVN